MIIPCVELKQMKVSSVKTCEETSSSPASSPYIDGVKSEMSMKTCWNDLHCLFLLQMQIAKIIHFTKKTNRSRVCNAGFRLTCRSPLCRYAAWSSLAVSELQLSAATPLWLFTQRQSLLSWIEFNCLRSAAVGKAARLSIYWLDAACRWVIPLRQVALTQLN